MLDLLMRVGVVLFMLGSLGGAGLGVTIRDAIAPLRQPRFLLVSFVTSWVVCPLAALIVLRLVPLAEPYAAGLVLLALAPCAPFAPAMVKTAKGDASALAAFMVFSAVTTVMFMPIGVSLMLGAVDISVWQIAQPLLLYVLAPLTIGMAVRYAAPLVAVRLRRVLELVTAGAGLLLLVVLGLLYGRGIVDAYGSHAVIAQAIFLLVITTVSHFIGALLHQEQQTVVTLGIATRNLGAALAAIGAVADERGVVMIAIAGVTTMLWSAVVARYLARQRSVPTLAVTPS
jgi:bile acid:Na+ symporter, BASS family